jgi:hypothetical protein
LFIAGVPASGKSFFGEWVESNKGFVHIDAEKNNKLDALQIHAIWDDWLATSDCGRLVSALQTLSQPIVVNWGFPTAYLPAVAALKRAGISCWWFDADLSQARVAFERMGKSIATFDKQVADITTERARILAVFEPNVVRALDSSGDRLSASRIWKTITNAP